jgi:hypothetical protein
MRDNIKPLTPNGVLEHYQEMWTAQACGVHRWSKGPSWQMPIDFGIAEFAPSPSRDMWTYATCGMSCQGDSEPLELHLFSLVQTPSHVELLTMVAHYHLTGSYLNLNHTVNFGRPWLEGSKASFGFVSLPYLDGPKLEWCEFRERKVRFLWLVPITERERSYASAFGSEALEDAFERQSFNYLDPLRTSVVE